jgi:hypothetical protein
MPTPEPTPHPDITVGRHPEFGIIATTPQHFAASAWMLKGFDFHPVPGHPTLYALADQYRDGQQRATHAVALLRKAGYRVEADPAFDPSPAPDPAPARDRPPHIEPDVTFAEHPRLGMVAATADDASLGGRILGEHGWRHNPSLDIYTLPLATERGEALGKIAQATLAMHRADLQVAVQPHLARDVALRRTAPDTTAAAARHQHSDGFTASRAMNAAALATSPTRANRPGTPPVPALAAPAPAAGPVDPRIAFSRNR